jgi:hypothetical protein
MGASAAFHNNEFKAEDEDEDEHEHEDDWGEHNTLSKASNRV